MKISRLDHLVLTVKDLNRTVEFYERVLGMRRQIFGEGRIALCFGRQKINLHQQGKEFEPKAKRACPGSADLCFMMETPLDEVVAQLKAMDVQVLEGPVQRTGAVEPIMSLYIRDPDENLLELSRPFSQA